MPIPLVAAGIAAAAGAIGSAGVNAYSAGKMNKRAERFSNEMYAKQRADALSDWHMQNAYNDPSAQMARLQAAGLNPNLVYGNGATTEAGSVRSSNQSAPDYKVPVAPDLSSVVINAMSMKQMQSNIARTEAETEAIKSRTAGTEFQNKLNEAIGFEAMQKRYAWANDQLEISRDKQLAEYNSWLAGSFEGRATDDPNSPVAKAIKAGYNQTLQSLENSKTLGDIQSFERTITAYKANLAKQGIPPDAPWYAKIIGDLISKATGLSIGVIGSSINQFLFK